MFTATHLHAMIVHFPIALVLVGFLFETIGLISKKDFFHKASFYILILAAAGAIVSYLTGHSAGEGMESGSLGTAIEAHEEAALVTLWLIVAVAVVRLVIEFWKKSFAWLKITAFILLLGAVAGVARTGYLGGQLVFRHAAGVELGFGSAEVATPETETTDAITGNSDDQENDDDND
jgi:uncharacterized membrane protein